jgi:hypothetical protein
LGGKKTSCNKTVTASPPYGGSGYEKHQSGLRPFVVFFSATFFAPVKMLRIFPYRAQKNVSYSQNVKQHFFVQNQLSLHAIHGMGNFLFLG